MNYIVGIGEILWDMLPEGKQLGGAPANFAFHASQAGMHGIVLSAIGFDSLGAETYDMLVKLDLDNILIDSDLPTSTVNVAIDANGIPHYEITENVAWDELAFVRSFKEIGGSECRMLRHAGSTLKDVARCHPCLSTRHARRQSEGV